MVRFKQSKNPLLPLNAPVCHVGVFLTEYSCDRASCLYCEPLCMFRQTCRCSESSSSCSAGYWPEQRQTNDCRSPEFWLNADDFDCPPHDERTGTTHFLPDGAWSLVRSSSSHNPPLLFYMAAELNQLLACDTECQMPSCPHYGASRGTPTRQKAFISHAFSEHSHLLPTKHKGCFLWTINIFVIIIITIIIIISYSYTVCFTQTYFCPCC